MNSERDCMLNAIYYNKEKEINYLACAVTFGAAVAEEVAVFGIRHVMPFVADASADRAHANLVYHFARVTVIPMLVHELFLCDRESAQLIGQTVFFRIVAGTVTVFFFAAAQLFRPVGIQVESRGQQFGVPWR